MHMHVCILTDDYKVKPGRFVITEDPYEMPNEETFYQGLHCWGPHGFWGSGENYYLFSGSWGALVIIFRNLGSKLSFGDLGMEPCKKVK